MNIFNIVVQIITYSCLAWSVGMVIFFLIKRHIVRKKAKKEIENETNEVGNNDE